MMQLSEYDNIHNSEMTHWWYRGLRSFVLNKMSEYYRYKEGGNFLDAGCGTGGMINDLHKNYPQAQISAFDYNERAVEYANSHKVAAVQQASINEIPFPDNHFDIITCLDVLYIKGVDAEKAISELYRVLKPEGLLFLNVCAFEHLRGAHDIVVQTNVRFTKASLGKICSVTEFQVLFSSYWNFLLSIPLTFWRIYSNKFIPVQDAKSDVRTTNPVINTILFNLIILEEKISRFISLPYGSSLFTILKK